MEGKVFFDLYNPAVLRYEEGTNKIPNMQHSRARKKNFYESQHHGGLSTMGVTSNSKRKPLDCRMSKGGGAK